MPIRHMTKRAFTLIEVLVVVAIVGIAGAVILPQMIQAGTLQIQAAGRIIVSDILFTQNEAIAQVSPRRVVFDVDNDRYSVTLADADSTPIAANWQSGQQYTIDFAGDSRFTGVSISAVDFNGGSVLEFDDLGAASTGGTIDLVAGSGSSRTQYRVTVTGFTGRVTIEPVTGGS